jgi:hypothetical protein
MKNYSSEPNSSLKNSQQILNASNNKHEIESQRPLS